MDVYYTNSKAVCDTWKLHSNEDILRTDNRKSGDNILLLPGAGGLIHGHFYLILLNIS